ncbi:MAG TPA: YqaA family protein [Caulobacterales bacterium]|nr:YqaA family protein [Caulobacterales bacterium]
MSVSIRDRALALAKSPQAEGALFGISFAEASFFPLPPDLLLGPMAAANPERWARYALTCTIASVLGGLLGYAIGMFVMDTVGNAILGFFGYGAAERLELQAFYDKWGLFAIFIKGLTPIPFKLVTILSGALHYSLPLFVVACIATRGARFFLVAWLFQRFGPQIAPVLEKRLGVVLIVVAVLLVGAIVAVRVFH